MRPTVNLHIFLSEVQSESRLFKETQSTLKKNIFQKVLVCGLWSEGLKKFEVTSWGLKIYRKKTMLNFYKGTSLIPKIGLISKVVALISILQYTFFVLYQAKRSCPTHISCHNVSMMPVSWLASKISGAHHIYVPHELETERIYLEGMKKKIASFIEKMFIYSCRDIVVVCDPIAKWYREKYVLDNVYVVRNVPKKSDMILNVESKHNFREIFDIPSTALILIYQGIIGPARSSTKLLETFLKIDKKNFHVVLMGFGEEDDIKEVQKLSKEVSNIHYHPAVHLSEITSYTSSANVGICLSESSSLSYKYSLANKFFEYLHSGLPVIVTNKLEYMSTIVNQNNLGWVTDINKLQDTIENIKIKDCEVRKIKVSTFAKGSVWEVDAKEYEKIYRH